MRESSARVKDDFPDAQLFRVDTVATTEMDDDQEDLWITEITILLSMGLLLEGKSLDERKTIAVRSQNLCLLNDTLYYKAADGIWRHAVQQFEKAEIL